MFEPFFEGYNAQDVLANPHLWSSDNWLLFQAGFLFAKRGASTPIKATKSRGFSVRIFTQANQWVMRFDKRLNFESLERLS
jgi:hypothetical protein